MGMDYSDNADEAGAGGQVSASDIFSDESSFYGDEDCTAGLEDRVAAYNPKEYWDVVQWNILCIAARAEQNQPQGIKRKRETTADPSVTENSTQSEQNSHLQDHTSRHNDIDMTPYNPFEGDRLARQLSESVQDFLMRLPPSTTSVGSGGPWIWIANPHSAWRPANEDIAGFKQNGSKALAEYVDRKSDLENRNPSKPQSSITRMLKQDRESLEARILTLAKQHRVTSGKWMLFLSPKEVDHDWDIVAKAVFENRLGSTAKVATDDGDPNNRYRLMCIYTVDFSDIDDVKRVLRKMYQLGLFKTSGEKAQVIYYKCDAYTYLDIANGNEYKLKASMYNSRDLMSEMST